MEKDKTGHEDVDLKLFSTVGGLGVRHLQVCMMSLCAAMLYMVRSSMGIAILAMTDTNTTATNIEIYEWSEEIRGVILSSFFWGYTVMQIPAGIMGKKFGGKPLLLAALVVNGILCLTTPFLARNGGWISVCAVRTMMGLTQACFMPCFHTILGKWAAPEERTRLGIFSYAGIQIGTIISMPICGFLSHTSIGWKLIYYSMGVMTLVTAVLWWAFSASTPAEHRLIKANERIYIENSLQTTGKEVDLPIPWRKIFTSRPLYAVLMTHIGCNWSFVFFLVEMPTYMKSGLGIDLASSSTLSALPFAAQWISSIAFSVVCEHIYNRKILSLTNARKLFNTIGCVGMAIGYLTVSFLYSEQKVVAVIALCFAVAAFGSNTCGFMLNHIDLSPNFGGLLFSFSNCIANLFAILVPIVTSFILGDDASDISRWRIVFCINAALIMTMDIIFRVWGTSELQSWNNPQKDHRYHSGKLDEKKNTIEVKKYNFATTKLDGET